MKVDIKVSAEMPEKVSDEYRYRSLCEKVEDYMLVCESDEDSYYHWRYLKCLYNKLHENPKLACKYPEVMEKLEGFMSKYGIYDSGEGQAEMTGERMFRYRDEA